jgi:heme exporter protein D
MSGLADYVAMGGYAAFVWPAYAIALIVLGGLAAQSWRRYRASLRALRRLEGGRAVHGTRA